MEQTEQTKNPEQDPVIAERMKAADEAFAEYKRHDVIERLLSLAPDAETREKLETLLHGTFLAGANFGARQAMREAIGSVVGVVIQRMQEGEDAETERPENVVLQ